MNYLVDTNILLWLIKGDRKRIGPKTWELLTSTATSNLHYSVASLWEIRIKVSSEKLNPPKGMEEKLAAYGVEVLNVTSEHTRPIETLEFRHKDPFDRMIIAQALVENLVLITTDAQILSYPEITCVDASQ